MAKQNKKRIVIVDDDCYFGHKVLVKRSRRAFDDVILLMAGALRSLSTQGAITKDTKEYLEELMTRLGTETNKIEIEFYKLTEGE